LAFGDLLRLPIPKTFSLRNRWFLSEKELYSLEGSPRDKLRCHVSTEVELNVSKASFFVRVPINTKVFNGESFIFDRSLEPLQSAPSHVLDSNTRSFGNQDHIRETMDDEGPVGLLDDIGQNAQSRGYGSISRTDIDVNVRAVIPFNMRRVDCVLDIGSVEVDELLRGPWEAEADPDWRAWRGQIGHCRRFGVADSSAQSFARVV